MVNQFDQTNAIDIERDYSKFIDASNWKGFERRRDFLLADGSLDWANWEWKAIGVFAGEMMDHDPGNTGPDPTPRPRNIYKTQAPDTPADIPIRPEGYSSEELRIIDPINPAFFDAVARVTDTPAPQPGEEVEEALRRLVERLETIHADPAYQSVWVVSQLHVGPYTGPNYVLEFAAAKAALRSASQPRDREDGP